MQIWQPYQKISLKVQSFSAQNPNNFLKSNIFPKKCWRCSSWNQSLENHLLSENVFTELRTSLLTAYDTTFLLEVFSHFISTHRRRKMSQRFCASFLRLFLSERIHSMLRCRPWQLSGVIVFTLRVLYLDTSRTSCSYTLRVLFFDC